MSLSITRYPLVRHAPPQYSPRLLEDSGLESLFAEYSINPLDYLTCDTAAIAERNAIIRLLLEHPSLCSAFEEFYACLNELSLILENKSTDPVLTMQLFSVFPKLHGIINTLILEIVSLPETTPEAIKQFGESLCELINRHFTAEYTSVLASLYTEVPKAINYCAVFDDEARLSHMVLNRLLETPHEKSKFGKHNAYLGKGMLLLKVREELPVAVNLREHLKNLLDMMFGIHTTDGKKQINGWIRCAFPCLGDLALQLAFFLAAVKLTSAWNLGTFCFAKICPMEEKQFNAEDLFHPLYAHHVTKTKVALDRNTSIALIGGTNCGGKTTCLRTVMAIRILFQMGYPVPAKSARLSPVDSIVCAFTRDENRGFGMGKLGAELTELKDAVSLLGEYSFFAFNEPITATSPMECRLLSKEILCIAKANGAGGIWVTHIHELHADALLLNSVLPGGRIESMRTAQKEDTVPQFTILPGVPKAGSIAQTVYRSVFADMP